jgi:hypothetical protein
MAPSIARHSKAVMYRWSRRMSPRVVAIIVASSVLLALVSTTGAASTRGMSGVSAPVMIGSVPPAAPSVRHDTASVGSDAFPIERPG